MAFVAKDLFANKSALVQIMTSICKSENLWGCFRLTRNYLEVAQSAK